MSQRSHVAESHYLQVNRRLAATHFFVNLLKDKTVASNQLQRQACIESALWQLYLGLWSYLNELLSYYRKPIPEDKDLTLQLLLQTLHESIFTGIPEYEELRLLTEHQEGLWGQLCRLPVILQNADTPLSSLSESSTKGDTGGDDRHESVPTNVIAVTQVTEYPPINTLEAVEQLLNQMQLLIDRHRESQTES